MNMCEHDNNKINLLNWLIYVINEEDKNYTKFIIIITIVIIIIMILLINDTLNRFFVFQIQTKTKKILKLNVT